MGLTNVGRQPVMHAAPCQAAKGRIEPSTRGFSVLPTELPVGCDDSGRKSRSDFWV